VPEKEGAVIQGPDRVLRRRRVNQCGRVDHSLPREQKGVL
jgi:hypothetical protein